MTLQRRHIVCVNWNNLEYQTFKKVHTARCMFTVKLQKAQQIQYFKLHLTCERHKAAVFWYLS